MENDIDQLSQDFLTEFEQIAADCQRLCHITRAKELQVEVLQRTNDFTKRVIELKNSAIAHADEESANILLSFEMLVTSLASQLKMWIALKDDDPTEAWNQLVHVQIIARDSMLAHEMGARLNAAKYIERLLVLEKLLFPPQMFFSIGGIIEYAKCSICNEEYGTCDHIVGRPYMGQLCNRIVTQYKLNEVSIVDNPANKSCRSTAITDTQGIMRDTMTWREVPYENQDNLENPDSEQVLEYFNQDDDF